MSGQLALAVTATVVVLVAVLGAGLVVRRRIISRRGGVVECGLRHSADRPWQHGLAEFRGGQLYWHRAMSLRLRPHAAFDRSEFAVLGSRAARPAEMARLGPGLVVISCRAPVRHRGRPANWRELELAMSPEAMTGLLAWLEGAPIYRARRASLSSPGSFLALAARLP